MSKPFVTLDMVRDHLGDRSIDLESKREGDLTWSDEEIKSAMEAAARSYNSLPPFVSNAHWSSMPANTDLFLDAAAAVAMERRIRKLAQDRTSFQAGGITTDPEGAIIDGLTGLAKELRAKFTREATAYKANQNWMASWGKVG